MKEAQELNLLFDLDKNFNIRSTIINDNIRVSTAAIFYESSFFGDYYQLETFIFKKEGNSLMKIHNVSATEKGLQYCIDFHNKTVCLIKNKLNENTSN